MTRFRRWPLAVACLGLILAIGSIRYSPLTGQPPAAPSTPHEPASFSPVVKKILPAVVSIESKAAPNSTALGSGSGVLIDPSGIVLTNHHVVEGAASAEVTLHDGRTFVARDIRRDPKTDLAVIKLDTKDALPALEFADSDAAEVGDRVLAAGAPFGLTGSVTHGIISGKIRTDLKLNPYEDWIQTDAAVNPGSSGGPLVTLDGKIVGITAAIKTRSGGFSGVALAVASNLCKPVAAQLLRDGVVRRGYLGAGVRDLDAAVAAKLGVRAGVVISKLHDDAPAGKAGLAVGDVVTSVGGQPVRTARDVLKVVAGLPLGQAAEVQIIRDGKAMVAKVVIEEQPAEAAPEPPAGVPVPGLGFAVADLTPDAAARLGFPKDTKGAVVAAVTRGGAADQAGLRVGQVVVKVDKTAVGSAAALREAVGKADRTKGALLHVLQPTGETDFVVLKLK